MKAKKPVKAEPTDRKCPFCGTDKEVAWRCQECGTSVCGACSSHYNHKELCPDCKAKEVGYLAAKRANKSVIESIPLAKTVPIGCRLCGATIEENHKPTCPFVTEAEKRSDPTPTGGVQNATASTLAPTKEDKKRPDPPSVRTTTTSRALSPDAAAVKGVGLADKLRSSTTSTSGTSNLKTVAGLVPTDEQRAILEAIMDVNLKALVIFAGAGCGKTAVCKMIETVRKGLGQYTAFNRSLVLDSRPKFKKASCKTTHALAYGTVGKRFAHRLDGNRMRSEQVASMLGINPITVDILGAEKPRVLSKGFLAGQALMAVRRFCQSADRTVAEKHFKYIDGIDIPVDGHRTYSNNELVKSYLLPFAEKIWKDQSDPSGQMPYNPDCYVKLWQLGEGKNKPVIGADYILLDEAQDTAPVFVDVLMQQTHALRVLVGDENQTIYEWRGTEDAMKAFPGAPRLMLSQSYRFGQAIADVANSILATLEKPTDLVLKGLPSIPSRVAPLSNPNCILCRTNAAAVSKVLQAVENNKRPHLIGGGSDVVDFVKAARSLMASVPTSHPQLCCFSNWQEVQAYVKEDEGEDMKLLVKLVDEFGCEPILEALENMPAEKDADLVVSTAHKSKGREWDTVALAGDFPPACRMNDSDRRLLYVAATRAKLQLDISDCPSFAPYTDKETGQQRPGLKVVFTSDQATEEELTAFAPQTTSSHSPERTSRATNRSVDSTERTNNKSANGSVQFTWSKYNDKWVVRGPCDHEDRTVKVVRKDGSSQDKVLGKAVAKFDDNWLYAV